MIEHDRVVMLAGIGNKPADYSDIDVESPQLIANEPLPGDHGSIGISLYPDDDDEAIVCAIIVLDTSLGLETVAEGVEEPNQAIFLRQKGIGIGQGYSFGRPVPADELAQAWQNTAADERTSSATPAQVRSKT